MATDLIGPAARPSEPAPIIAAVDPTTIDDSHDGYVVGQHWINTATGNELVATDVTIGAAVWKSTTAQGGGGGTVPTGTGFVHVTGAAQDAAARAVDVSSADVTGTLAAARFPALTGDVTTSAGALATTIAANAVTNAKAAQMAANTIKGNNTAGTANAADLTAAQTKALLAIASSDVSGLAAVATSGSAADLGAGTLPAGRLPALTGDVTTSAGAVATTIAVGAVTLAKQANLAANSIQGNNTGSPAAPSALSGAQVTAMLSPFVASGASHAIGLVPDPGVSAGTTKFLREDATWVVPAGGGGTVPTGTGFTHITSGAQDAAAKLVAETDLSFTDITTANVSTSQHGLHPKLPNDASQFLAGDGNYYAQPWYWRKLGFIFDDFIGGAGTGSFNQSTTGSGAGWNFGTGDATCAGIVTGVTGTTTTGSARIGGSTSGVPSNVILGSGTAYYEAKFRLTQLSNGTDTFTLRIGMSDNTGGGDPTDGVFIRYTDAVNGGKFQLVTRSNSSETATDTTVTAASATWYVLKITVNAAGTSVTCDINGTAVTASTNIPTGAARATALISSIIKSLGTTSVGFDFDYIAFTYNFTASR